MPKKSKKKKSQKKKSTPRKTPFDWHIPKGAIIVNSDITVWDESDYVEEDQATHRCRL